MGQVSRLLCWARIIIATNPTIDRIAVGVVGVRKRPVADYSLKSLTILNRDINRAVKNVNLVMKNHCVSPSLLSDDGDSDVDESHS